jgi:hypothetical protein
MIEGDIRIRPLAQSWDVQLPSGAIVHVHVEPGREDDSEEYLTRDDYLFVGELLDLIVRGPRRPTVVSSDGSTTSPMPPGATITTPDGEPFRPTFPDSSAAARATFGSADYRTQTSEAIDLYLSRRTEATLQLMLESLKAWPTSQYYDHCGMMLAINEEFTRWKKAPFWVVLFLRVTFSLVRGKYAATWNDHLILRFKFRRDRATMTEIHRRMHRQGDKWRQVRETMRWAVGSLYSSDPTFKAAFQDLVASLPCSDCASEFSTGGAGVSGVAG